MIIRESSEGDYTSIEHEVLPGIIETIKVITREKSRRIAEYAFEYALLSNRKKVTVVHKANVSKVVDAQFLEVAQEVASQYPDIVFEEMHVGRCCTNLVKNPQEFDVMLMPNTYGSVIGNICAALVGGPGVAPGANVGQEYTMFEQGARHSARNLAELGTANPTGFLLSAAMMLRHMNLPLFAEIMQNSVIRAIREGKGTPDIGGSSSTREFTREVTKILEQS